MKKQFFKLQLLSLLIGLFSFSSNAQSSLPQAAVLNIDTKGINFDPVQMGNLVRIELDKLNKYRLMDRYDLEYLVEKHALKIENCYGAICVTSVGKVLGVDKILSGSVEIAGEMIIVQFRLIDIATQSVDLSAVRQYLKIPAEVNEMISITLKEMYGMPVNEDIKRKLTKQYDYDNLINNPTAYRLASDGPRMGFTAFTGQTARRLEEKTSTGGYDAFPVMFQFGYQFEKQYLNEGRYQALFEFIPMVTGIDQQLFIPSFTIMNGFRDNYKGWEIAFGPTFNFVKRRDWAQLNGEWIDIGNGIEAPIGADIVSRMDSRGLPNLSSGFIIAFGKTFKSGHMNLPVNGYVIPNKHGMRLGVSFGFNAKNKGMNPPSFN